MHIGKEIRKVMDQRGVKPAWLAQQISTSRRNMYDILKRADISTGVLVEISKYLGFNFLSLYNENLPMAEDNTADYGKLKHENELLREQLDLTNKLIDSKEKLLKEYRKKVSVNS